MMGLKDFYFRATDRLRLEGCVAAMLTEGMSLVVSSKHDAVLDHYGKLMVDRLRQSSPNTQVEIYFPANADVVLARFNSMVAEQSFEEAMKASAGQAPARIWLVHDAGSLPDSELQLLVRLVQSFPGARVRLLFLLSSRGHGRPLFDNFGRGVLRWDIEVPSLELAQNLMEKAKADGLGAELQALLAKISLPPSQSPPGFEKHLLLEDPVPPLVIDGQPSKSRSIKSWFNRAKEREPNLPKKSVKTASSSRQKGRQSLKIGLAVIVLLLVSFAISLVLHPDLLSFHNETVKPVNIKPIGQVQPNPAPKEPSHE